MTYLDFEKKSSMPLHFNLATTYNYPNQILTDQKNGYLRVIAGVLITR